MDDLLLVVLGEVAQHCEVRAKAALAHLDRPLAGVARLAVGVEHVVTLDTVEAIRSTYLLLTLTQWMKQLPATRSPCTRAAPAPTAPAPRESVCTAGCRPARELR
jgi:hypothetical protein